MARKGEKEEKEKSYGKGSEEKTGAGEGSLKDKIKPLDKGKVSKMSLLDEKKKLHALAGGKRKMPNFVYGALIVVLVIVLMGIVTVFSPAPAAQKGAVKEGDVVQIMYRGSLGNGEVFDSGNITFTVGSGQVIEGIEEALIGMEVGQMKKVTVPPEKAYGERKESNLMAVPRVSTISRTQVLRKDVFESTFDREPQVGEEYTVEGMAWPLKVTKILNETITVSNEAEDGMTFEREDLMGNVYATAEVSVEGEEISIKLYPDLGGEIVTTTGRGNITDVGEDEFTIDFNHELAGKTLYFDIQLMDFIPG